MTDIPDDIMQAANECVSEFRWNNDNRWHMFVARAILAERERSRQLLSEVEKREKEAREKALEEAAKSCDKIAGNTADFDRYTRRASGMCAAAIRALQSEER
ncbi:hypothetical protein [Agrobacterium radiobacter]|uniref:hypothetical protein n=1 Tax=Agrobacterium radiobacter TaxID=362 RepID=UPI003F846BDC